MTPSTRGTTKRKRPDQPGTSINVRLQPTHLSALDHWIEGQGGGISRPEAIRAILATALEL
jgi:hypothetical protein